MVVHGGLARPKQRPLAYSIAVVVHDGPARPNLRLLTRSIAVVGNYLECIHMLRPIDDVVDHVVHCRLLKLFSTTTRLLSRFLFGVKRRFPPSKDRFQMSYVDILGSSLVTKLEGLRPAFQFHCNRIARSGLLKQALPEKWFIIINLKIDLNISTFDHLA